MATKEQQIEDADRGDSSTAALLPGVSTAMTAGVVAALYVLYWLTNAIFGEYYFGAKSYYWHEALVEIETLIVLAWASSCTVRPYRLFLRMLVCAIAMLAVSAVTFEQPCWKVGPGGGEVLWWELAYALFLFLWVCAWGYLIVELWPMRNPSAATGVVFVVLMIGLAAIYVQFYSPLLGKDAQAQLAANYKGPPAATPTACTAPAATPLKTKSRTSTNSLKIKVVHAALELGAVMVGLAAVLLGVPGALVVLVFGMTTLAAFNMAYTTFGQNVAAVDPVWMFGLCLLLVGALAIRRQDVPEAVQSGPALARSGLSGILLLLSLGAVILVVNVGEIIKTGPWLKPFLLAFVVVLVLIMVWITNRFDRAVQFLSSYAAELIDNRLRGAEWRGESPTIQGILKSTGLGKYLDYLRDSLGEIRKDVIFLGPERLNRPPVADSQDGRLRCFLVMPFSEDDWSDEVHGIIAGACRMNGVTAVRGDDLFSPTDIVDDIWQALHSADFVLADITGRNPNVLYELGIAHTIAKPVLLLSQDQKDIPFDLASLRVKLYDRSRPKWQDDLKAGVSEAIGLLLKKYKLTPSERALMSDPRMSPATDPQTSDAAAARGDASAIEASVAEPAAASVDASDTAADRADAELGDGSSNEGPSPRDP